MRNLILVFLFANALLAGITGNVKGVVKDQNGVPVSGAEVSATSPALQGDQKAKTDKDGLYVISNLPPGVYTLRAEFNKSVSERKGIDVYIDKTLSGDMTLMLKPAAKPNTEPEIGSEGEGEVYQITEKANHIDVASSTVGVTLTKDYIKNVPLGRDRNFTNAMNALPSAGSDAYGQSVGGATSPENIFVIDGMNATDPSSGLSGTRMVMEFVDEFDVKEGGYGPEFGRATGGVVNAATKSGGNEFHGSVFAYYRPGFLQATPRLINKIDNSLSTRNKLDYYLNVGAELGGPIVKDKLWFHLGYAPEIQHDYWLRELRPIEQDPVTQNATRDAFGQLRLGDVVYRDQFDGFAQTHQYTVKLTHEIDSNNRQSLGVRGAPTIFNGAVGNPFDASSPSLGLNADPSTFQLKQWGGNVVTGVYNYAGKYFNDKLKLDATAGVHHQENHWGPTMSKLSDARSIFLYNTGLGTVWDPPPPGCSGTFLDGSARCQVRNYAKGGIGSFNDSTLDRFSEKVMLTSLFDLIGLHQLKYGIDFEQLRGRKEHGYTGGSFYQFDQSELQQTEYFVRGLGAVGAAQGYKFPSLAQTLNWGAFVGDSWNPIPQLTFNYGLRWEGQDFYGVKNPAMTINELSLEKKFSILDNLAPRAGVVWDMSGSGKAVVRFNYGRYYESIPMDINERGFGGEAQRITMWDCPSGSTSPDQCKSIKKSETTLGGKDAIVVPGIKGQYSDEFIVSADYEPFTSWIFGVAGVYRTLGRVIEDMSNDGGETYVYANPGFYGSVPRATRDIWQLQFKLDKKLSEHFMFLATYVLSWAHGNYPGLYSANNGQLDPNLSSQFDMPQLIVNRDGYLPQDQRHRVKLSGFYKASLKDYGLNVPLSFTVGLSGNVQSGRPNDYLGRDALYGPDEIFILPRGLAGRTPWYWSVDLNIGVGYDITQDMTAELFATFFNLTNNQGTVAVDNTYTYDSVRPIVDGTPDQLDYAVNNKGKPISKNPNYGNPTAFQAPFSTQLGFRLRF